MSLAHQNIALFCILYLAMHVTDAHAFAGVSDKYKDVESDYSIEVDGLTVSFENFSLSESTDLVFEWDLGDGTVVYDKQINHTYNKLGHFQTCLTIYDIRTTEVVTKVCKYVDLGDPNLCEIDWNPVCGCDNQTYMNPCFAETYHGIFYWRLGACPDNTDRTLRPEYTFNVKGMTIDFVNASFGSYDMMYWDFGDGANSSKPNPKHKYKSKGAYDICLTVMDSYTNVNQSYCESIELR